MNFIEAIKSGRPIRRVSKQTWNSHDDKTYYNTLADGYICPSMFFSHIYFDKEDVLAEDWETKE